MSKRIKISQDDKNFNRHTEDGMALLKKSVSEVGVIESITVASDGKIISGNARNETFSEVLGDVEPIVVEADGTRPVVIRRTDIDSETDKFYKAAILANTTAQKNIDIDVKLVKKVAVKEFSMDVKELGVEDLSRGFFGSKQTRGSEESEGQELRGYPITVIVSESEYEDWVKAKEKAQERSDAAFFYKIFKSTQNDTGI
jgi:hypothetical protein